MNDKSFSRRNFLRGAGGFALALPMLPSLLPRKAFSETAPASELRFVGIQTKHGAVDRKDMYPDDAILTRSMDDYGPHPVRSGDLDRTLSGDRASISRVLSADKSILTDRIVSKMNVIDGLGFPFILGHHNAGLLGNTAANESSHADGQAAKQNPYPTIDQVMAWSDAFYPDLSGVRKRSMNIQARRGSQYEASMSWGWSDPANRTGDIVRTSQEESSLTLFRDLFLPGGDEGAMETPIVDRVHENYRRLRDSSRISHDDRQRLERHMTMIEELQRRVGAQVSCNPPLPNKDAADVRKNTSGFQRNLDAQAEFWRLHNDVVVAALACGTCRIATFNLHRMSYFTTFDGDHHNECAHRSHAVPEYAAIMRETHQRYFENVFLDLVQKLDAVELSPGVSLLDQTLVTWSQECGPVTHVDDEIPVVTAGSAGGYFKTGQFLDYRNLARRKVGGNHEHYSGLLYNQWLGEILRAMRVPEGHYPSNGEGGYGWIYLGQAHDNYSRFKDARPVVGEKMPFLVA